jgi:two-component system LytT family response regulator
MIRCYLVDDEKNAIKLLTETLGDIDTPCKIVGSANSIQTAAHDLQQLDVDLLFLDIKLGADTSFKLLDMFEEPPFKVIFVTAYNQFAIKAFEYNAINYLLKPLDKTRVEVAVKRAALSAPKLEQTQLLAALKLVKQQELKRVAIPSLERTEFIDLDKIEHLSGDGSYTHIMLSSKEKLTSSRPLAYFEKLLPSSQFCRVHKRHIINIDHILEMEKGRSPTLFLRTGATLPVSSGNKELLYQALETRIRF